MNLPRSGTARQSTSIMARKWNALQGFFLLARSRTRRILPRIMAADADGYETTIPDAACAAAIEALLAAVTLESSDILSERKARRPNLAPDGHAYADNVYRLIRLILRRLLGAPGAVSDGDIEGACERVNQRTSSALAALAARRDPEATRQALEEGAPYAVEALSTMMDQRAADEVDASVLLERNEEGVGLVFRWKRITPEEKFLEPLVFLLHALHRHAQTAPVTAFERTACEWWFGLESEQGPERLLLRRRREREWSLMDRKSFAVDQTVLKMARATGFLDTLPQRVRRLAKSARRSRTGVFVVREQSGRDVTLEDAEARELVMLREHDATRMHEAGAVIVGRLYPYKDGWYLRSPAAFVFDGASVPASEQLVEWIAGLERERFPRAVAIEAVVTQHILVPWLELPHTVAPAGSREEARRALDAVRAGMEHAGMFKHPLADGALWLEPSGDKGRCTIFGWEADLPLAHWVESLLELAGIAAEFRR